MKIINEKGYRLAEVKHENNFILNVQENSVMNSKQILLAKSITEENLHKYFREISPEEAAKLKEQEEEEE